MCCFSYTDLVKVAPFLCVDKSLGNVQVLVWGQDFKAPIEV